MLTLNIEQDYHNFYVIPYLNLDLRQLNEAIQRASGLIKEAKESQPKINIEATEETQDRPDRTTRIRISIVKLKGQHQWGQKITQLIIQVHCQ